MRLFVSDIDGTLYWYHNRNNAGCSEACKAAIRKWIDAGNIFALATARVYTVRDVAIADLGLKVDYLGGNGAEIVYRNYEIELHTLPIQYFFEIGKWIDEHHYDATVKACVKGQFISYRQDRYPFTCLERMRKNLKNSIPYEQAGIDAKDSVVNMSLLCEPSLTQKIEKELQNLFLDRCQVLATDMDNLDFIPLGISKSQAVLALAERYGIKREDIIVIGDAPNDVPMFQITENSYCMSHGKAEIKRQAAKIVDLVEEAIEAELKKDREKSII